MFVLFYRTSCVLYVAKRTYKTRGSSSSPLYKKNGEDAENLKLTLQTWLKLFTRTSSSALRWLYTHVTHASRANYLLCAYVYEQRLI